MKKIREHHTALTRGYIHIGEEIKEKYKGRFGEGYTIKKHNPQSTQYCLKTYYIYVEE